ncbi:hypothetical protein GCM10007963_18740 [Lutibacter litoralis]|nr:hypothetical protein GCM10007963_18740 [Lutibacter litoralis]
MLVLEKKDFKVLKATNRIYINTLIPKFYFKNKIGKIVNMSNSCVKL